MSGMTSRTKIGVCIGVLALAAGVALLLPRRTSPLTVTFVGYLEEELAVLSLTNCGRTVIRCDFATRQLFDSNLDLLHWPDYELMPRNGTQVWMWARNPGPFSIKYAPKPSNLRRCFESLLSTIGIDLASTGFVATVELPAR